MDGPRSRESLHRMRRRGLHRTSGRDHDLEATLDQLLDDPQRDGARARVTDPPPEPSPLERLRTLVPEQLMPVIANLNQRYADRDICVTMDPSDFLGGGRGMVIEISFRDAHLRIEGTVTSDAIAFQETRQFVDRPGAVVGGPMLRTKRLNAQAFNDFLHERIITLVKAATAAP